MASKYHICSNLYRVFHFVKWAFGYRCKQTSLLSKTGKRGNNFQTPGRTSLGPHVFPCMCDTARRGFPERGLSLFHADTCLLEWRHHFLVSRKRLYTQFKVEPKQVVLMNRCMYRIFV